MLELHGKAFDKSYNPQARNLCLTLGHTTTLAYHLLFCRVAINFILEFLVRAPEKVGFGRLSNVHWMFYVAAHSEC